MRSKANKFERCWQFQELSWMDGHRTPLDGKRLRMYIMSMREVVDFYKGIMLSPTTKTDCTP